MSTRRITIRIAILLTLAVPLVGCSGGGPKPQYHDQLQSSLTATVQAIDYPTRTVTIKDDSGEVVTFVADKRVRNLERIKAGDRVNVQYHESISVNVRDPKAAGEGDATAAVDFRDWSEGPEGSFGRQTTITAVVEKVDRKQGSVDLRGPAGNVRRFWLRDPKKLENVKVGDQVVATHREALAVAITPVGR